MHFAKSYAEAAKDLPEEWHPYLISYKALKKCIGRIVQELEGRGLSVELLKELQDRSAYESCPEKTSGHKESPGGNRCPTTSTPSPGAHYAEHLLVPPAAAGPTDQQVALTASGYQQVLLDTDRQKLLYTFSDSSHPCLVVIVNEQPELWSTDPTPASTAPASPTLPSSPVSSDDAESCEESDQQECPALEVQLAQVLSERLNRLELTSRHPFILESLSDDSCATLVELTNSEESEYDQQHDFFENDDHDEEEDRAHEEREQDEMDRHFPVRGVFDAPAPSILLNSDAPPVSVVPVVGERPSYQSLAACGERIVKRAKFDSQTGSLASNDSPADGPAPTPSAVTGAVYRAVRSRRPSRRTYTTIYADDGQAVKIARGRRSERGRPPGLSGGSHDAPPKVLFEADATDLSGRLPLCDASTCSALLSAVPLAGPEAAERTKAIRVTLRTDVDFFNTIVTAITKLGEFQNAVKTVYEQRIRRIADLVAAAATPQQGYPSAFGFGRTPSDMYAWREIMATFAEEEIWFDESGVVMRCDTVKLEKCRFRFGEWERLASERCLPKLKLPKSKVAFADFLKLNRDLLAMKQFREMNKMAIGKILKKHDKRTRLICRAGFEGLIAQNSFIHESLTHALCCAVADRLMTIVPQPQDYSCPVCMSISWKPIRLSCGHVFCVRCLIKAQRRKMTNCPLCRRTGSVAQATADNLDVSLMNLLRLYFPREIKEKRRENAKELLELDGLY